MNLGRKPIYAAALLAAVLLLGSCETGGFPESTTNEEESTVMTEIEECVTTAKPEETPDLTLSDRKLGSADTVNTVSGSWNWKSGILTGSNQVACCIIGALAVTPVRSMCLNISGKIIFIINKIIHTAPC